MIVFILWQLGDSLKLLEERIKRVGKPRPPQTNVPSKSPSKPTSSRNEVNDVIQVTKQMPTSECSEKKLDTVEETNEISQAQDTALVYPR